MSAASLGSISFPSHTFYRDAQAAPAAVSSGRLSPSVAQAAPSTGGRRPSFVESLGAPGNLLAHALHNCTATVTVGGNVFKFASEGHATAAQAEAAAIKGALRQAGVTCETNGWAVMPKLAD
jgi:hypothetical protein